MAEKMLSEKLGEVEYDGLIAGVNPKKRVGPGVIAGPEAETTFVRGTVFAKSAKDGKLHILGTEASGGDTLTADCILIEDVTMKASMDETVAVYLAGCFNPDKLTVKDSYTMTEADKDALRMRDIVLLPVVEMYQEDVSMAILINFFDNVILQAISEEIVPKVSFFKDRYFPTGAGDIFKANEVLTEYRSGDRKLAAFVDQKAGDIPIGRRSYEVHSYKPAYIAPSRLLTLDELTKRGFGEALYPGMDEAQRAARLLADDMNDMENRIARREEWMAAETMIGNGCVMQEYIDGATKGDSLVVKFYDGTSDHTYTASKKWNENGGDFWGDVKAMCRMLSARGLPAKDLILGTDVADYILTDERTRQLLDKNSGIIVGEIRQQLTQYDGVVFMGTLNFGGFMLNVFSVDETYEDETGKSARYFPATAAMVTAPDCGHMMYGSITQMDYGKTDYTTYAAKRVAKLVVDQDKDTRKLRLGCRPLAAPKTYCPYIYAADVVG